MNTIQTEKTLLLSKKGMKELKKSIANLEHDLQRARQNLRELDKTTGHDERFERIEKLAMLESIEAELSDKQLVLSSAKLLPTKRAQSASCHRISCRPHRSARTLVPLYDCR